MQTKGLDKRQNGNVIWIAPKDELMAKEKLEYEAKSAVADLEPLTTEYIQLNYMRADDAKSMLYGAATALNAAADAVNCSAQAQGLTSAPPPASGAAEGEQKVLTKRGRATYELKTNTLIVTDTPRKIQEVRELLARLDVPARQVMIEARVVVATDGWSRDLGVRMGFAAAKTFGDHRVGGTDKDPNSDVLGLGQGLGLVPGAAQLALGVLNIGNGNLLTLELQALEADSKGKILSNPRVMTSNQKPAVILNGTQIPYVTTSVSDGAVQSTVTFKDAFLCLLVDPQILNNDSIILTVEVQKDAARFAPGIEVPAIDTKRIKTQVRVNNGETRVLGGIFDGEESSSVDKVPMLGDMPVFGNLFKTTNKANSKTELIIFITPRILDERLSLR
jgi:type IV pilus assembly protein PilQ